jgi:hypothetical protein
VVGEDTLKLHGSAAAVKDCEQGGGGETPPTVQTPPTPDSPGQRARASGRSHLKEFKADISYFKRSYERADLQVTIAGLDPETSAAAIDARLGRT